MLRISYIIMQACRVPSNMWSKVGRLKRSVMPKLTKGSNIFGSGASPGIMSCIAGRILCDTYLCSRDLLREVGFLESKLFLTCYVLIFVIVCNYYIILAFRLAIP